MHKGRDLARTAGRIYPAVRDRHFAINLDNSYLEVAPAAGTKDEDEEKAPVAMGMDGSKAAEREMKKTTKRRRQRRKMRQAVQQPR